MPASGNTRDQNGFNSYGNDHSPIPTGNMLKTPTYPKEPNSGLVRMLSGNEMQAPLGQYSS